MIQRLVLAMTGLATAMLPAPRKAWADAMKAEALSIADGWAAVRFAGGCLLAAARERVCDLDTRFAAGLLSLSLFSIAAALFHTRCALRGARILLGRPDPFFRMLHQSNPSAAAAYRHAVPFVVGCFILLGLAHMSAAYLLARGRLRAFLLVWCATLAAAALAVAIQLSIVWTPGGVPSEFIAPIVQALDLSALLFGSGRWERIR